jgi:gliding motility-associated-like protein
MRNLILLFCLFFTPFVLSANRHYVKNTNDSGAESLRDIIANASSGDTVFVDVSGVLNLQSFISFNQDLVLIGPGPAHFTINGSAVSGLESGFDFVTGNHNVFIEGIHFTNFSSSHAIGTNTGFTGFIDVFGCLFEGNPNTPINIDGGNIKLESCSFINNYSPNEAGVMLFSGNQLDVINCTFYENSSNLEGGALFLSSGIVNLTNNTFYNNGVSSPVIGKAIYVVGSNVTARNNIFYNQTGQTNRIIEIVSGSINSLGGNVTNDINGNGGIPSGTDIFGAGVNIGFNNTHMVTDGWGLKYFPIQDPNADAVDIDNNPSGLTAFDQRRVWRVMDAGFGQAYADAGAVEYTPNIISAPSDFAIVNSNLGSFTGNEAVVFNLPWPYTISGGNIPLGGLNISKSNTIVNGFSQSWSNVPGPGNGMDTIVASSNSMVVLDGNGNNTNQAILVGASTDNVIIAGLEIINFNTASDAAAIRIHGQGVVIIEGCHIGSVHFGTSEYNKYGIDATNNSSFYLGGFGYVGKLYHNRRNVISGNTNIGIRSNSVNQNVIQNNIFGLVSDGLTEFESEPTIDSSIVLLNTTGFGNTIGGGYWEDRNVFTGNAVGVYSEGPNNKIHNNIFGLDFSGEVISFRTIKQAIVLLGSSASNNEIGDIGRGNYFASSGEGAIFIDNASNNEIFSNNFGYAISLNQVNANNPEFTIAIYGNTASNNIIGGAGDRRNFICNSTNGDFNWGIYIEDAIGTKIQNNFIGIMPDSTIGTIEGRGIELFNDSASVIGGMNLGNYIGNTDVGILLSGDASFLSNDSIIGNTIGKIPNTSISSSNNIGVSVLDHKGAFIGDTINGLGNIIWENNIKGIQIESGDNIYIANNSLHNNNPFFSAPYPFGIDLGPLDVENQDYDPPTENDGIVPPYLHYAVNCITTKFDLDLSNEVGEDYMLEFFKTTNGNEGDTLIYRTYVTQSVPNEVFSIDFGFLFEGDFVATCTRLTNNNPALSKMVTSEFSYSSYADELYPLYIYVSQDTICEGTTPVLYSESESSFNNIWFTSNDYNPANRVHEGEIYFPSGLSVGSYTYWLVDSTAGCYGPYGDSVVITVLPTPQLIYNDSICNSTLSDVVTFGTHVYPGNYDAIWSGGSPVSSPNNNIDISGSFFNSFYLEYEMSFNSGSSDTLIVELVSDACMITDTAIIRVFSPPSVATPGFSHPSTCGGTDGVIFYTGLLPSSSYDVFMNGNITPNTVTTDGSGMLSILNLLQGTYIMDSIGNSGVNCRSVLNETITLNDPPFPIVTVGPDYFICEGESATLTGTASGTTGPYSYSWDNGGGVTQTTIVNPLTTTTYTLTVTDNPTACVSTDQVTVIVNSSPIINVNSIDICEGSSHTYNPSVVGGSAPYTFDWSPAGDFLNSTVQNATTNNLFAGVYNHSLTVTDANGCLGTGMATLTINLLPNEGNPFVTDLSCNGASNGAIMLAPLGTYTFDWSGPNGFTATTQDINGLEAGNYALTMIDNFSGCLNTYNTIVNEPSAITPNAFTTDASCFGSADGTLSASAFGGAGTFVYEWYLDAGFTSLYSSGNTLSGVPANTYYLQVTDANGCENDTTVFVNEPPAMILSTSVISNYNGSDISCNGGSDGELQATVSGGFAPYTYSWDDGSNSVGTSQIASNLPAGNYNITVNDMNGCIQNASISLTDPTLLNASFNFTDVSCFGLSDGTLEGNPFGGSGGLTVNWYTDPFGSTFYASGQILNNVPPGNYSLEVVDGNGCTDIVVSLTINEPTEILASFGSTQEICDGNSDGSLFVQNVSGGVTSTSYTVSWQTNPGGVSVGTGDSLINVGVGDYIGEVTDANGCLVNGIVDIQPGETFNPFIAVFSSDSCVNSNSFTFEPLSTPPSGLNSISWNFANATPATSSNIVASGIQFNGAGNQTVDASYTSNNGCIFDTTFTVQIFDTATLDIQSIDISCFGSVDGSITSSASGGLPPYQYSFNSGAFATINSWNALNTGSYSLQVQDNAGCVGTLQNVVIIEPTEITYDTLVTDITCGLNNGAIEIISVNGGVGTVSFEWFEDNDFMTSLGNNNPLTSLTSQTYYLIGTDANGCQVYGNATVGVGVASIPVPTIDQGTLLAICEDPSGSSYPVLSATSNAPTTGIFTWYIGSLSGNTSTGNTLDLDNSNVANHYIYLTEENGGCVSEADSIELQLEIYDATFDYEPSFCLGDAVQINGSGSGDILWYNSNEDVSDTTIFNPIITPTSATSTYYMYIGTNNCLFYDSIVLVANPNCNNNVITVNAFSPDGDGVNDNFILDIPSLLVEENTVTIVNRWGDEIQKYQNYNNNDIVWDGRNKNGQLVTNGTYFYIVEIPSLQFKQTGWIQVVR